MPLILGWGVYGLGSIKAPGSTAGTKGYFELEQSPWVPMGRLLDPGN